MKAKFSLTIVAILVALGGIGYAAVHTGTLSNPFSNLSAVTSSITGTCFSAEQISEIRMQVKALEESLAPVTKIPNEKSVNWQIGEADKAKKALETEITKTNTELAALKRTIPAPATLAGAKKKIETLEAEKTRLEAKASRTAAETKRLSLLPDLIAVAVKAETDLLAISPAYDAKVAVFEERKLVLLPQIEQKKADIVTLNATKKTLTADLAKAKKDLSTAESKLCTLFCLTPEDLSNKTSFEAKAKTYPAKIQELQRKREEAVKNLPALEKELPAAKALADKATPEEIARVKKAADDVQAQYQAIVNPPRTSPLYAQRAALVAKWQKELSPAYSKIFYAKANYEGKLAKIAGYKEAIEKAKTELPPLEAEYAKIQTELPKLQKKEKDVGGKRCVAPVVPTTDVTNSTQTGTNNTSNTNTTNPPADYWPRPNNDDENYFSLENSIAECHDGIDNDGIGGRDCGSGIPRRGGDINCIPKYCDEHIYCNDGEDNDADGDVDKDDSECYSRDESQHCADLNDNDHDGSVDCADSDCANSISCTQNESEKPGGCYDGRDQDGDGKTDCADPNCEGVIVSQFIGGSRGGGLHCYTETSCNRLILKCQGGRAIYENGDSENNAGGCSNGIDDDGDGAVDGNDSDCGGGGTGEGGTTESSVY